MAGEIMGPDDVYEVTVTRSASTDGAVVIYVDGPCDGLRIRLNDEVVYANPELVDGQSAERKAGEVKMSATYEQIAYVTKTWTFCGYWGDDGRIAVEYSLDGEVQDKRKDNGQHEGGLWASHATGRTEEEAQARALAEYQEELLAEVVEEELGEEFVLEDDGWFDALIAHGLSESEIVEALSSGDGV